MNDEVKNEQVQEETKPNEDVSKVFGNTEDKKGKPAKETVDSTTTDQEETKNENPEKKQESSPSATGEKQSDKTYTQKEVDAMMAKVRKKYVGADASNAEVTKGVDVEGVENEKGEGAEENPAAEEVTQDLATGLSIEKYVQAELKATMAIEGVNPSKVQRAVRLVDIANVLDNGQFSEEKAKAEIEALLQEWPELKKENSAESNNAFSFGVPGQEEQATEEKQKNMFSSIFGNDK